MKWDIVQYHINREAVKVSDLSSAKFDKNEYLTGEDILLLDQGRVIEQSKFKYSLLNQALEKTNKINSRSRKKQVDEFRSFKN